MNRRLVISTVVLAMMITACGGEAVTLTPQEQALADALVVEFENEPDAPLGGEEGARCFAERLVADFGVERLGEIGMVEGSLAEEPDFASLDDGEIDRLADIAMQCVDYETAFAAEVVGQGISESGARCLAKELDEAGFFRETLISGLTGRDVDAETMFGEFLGAAGRCLSTEEFNRFIGG